MSLFDCLASAIDQNAVKANKAKVAQDLFQELRTRYEEVMDPATAASRAGADTKKIMKEQLEARRRAVAAQALFQRRIDAEFDAFRNHRGENDMGRAMVETMRKTLNHENAVRRDLFRNLNDFLTKHGRNIIGNTRNKAGLKNVELELEGTSTGDAQAKVLATAIRDAMDLAHKQRNAAGGHTGYIDGYVPHAWNRATVLRVSEAEFIADMKANLDWTKVHDPATNQPFGSPNAPGVDAFLQSARQSITTDGWNKRFPKFQQLGQALYNREADHRVLHFKPGTWGTIAEKYGSPNIVDAVTGYLDSMARDIAMMRTLGPNPTLSTAYMEQKVLQQASTSGDIKATSRANTMINRARNMLSIISGTASTPVNEGMAAFFAGTRDVLTAAYLGSAIVSSTTDLHTVSMGAKYVGMGRSQVLTRAVQNLTSGRSKEDMQRTFGVLETLLETSAAMSRWTGDTFGPELTRRMSSFVIRAQGLAHWTDILRASFQMEFMGFMASNAKKPFDKLPPELQRFLSTRGGITPAEWDMIRAQPLHQGRTGTFLVPNDLRRSGLTPEEGEGLAIRLQGAIEDAMEQAIPSRDIEASAMLGGAVRPGTFEGEMLRSGLQFKNFGLSFLMNQIRATQGVPTASGKVAYAAQMIAGMTILGALAVQLKDTLKGRDPRDMTTPGFWGAAAVQGGGFGIFGDFFQAGQSRFGGGFAETLAGPSVGFAEDVYSLTAGNMFTAINGDDPRWGRDFTNFVRFNMPGGSLWYARPVLEHAVFENMQRALDPEAAEYWRRQAKQQFRDYGSKNWWKRGDALPARAPDLGSAIQ